MRFYNFMSFSNFEDTFKRETDKVQFKKFEIVKYAPKSITYILQLMRKSKTMEIRLFKVMSILVVTNDLPL